MIEDGLARTNAPFAVAYLDKRSAFTRRLLAAGSVGFMNAAMETPVRVMSWLQGMSAAEQHALTQRPLYISPLDIT